jgi:hypothetical protein
MGWWKTGNNDDILGDNPADAITIRLREMVEDLEKQGKEKPTWPELLNAIENLIRGREDQYLYQGAQTPLPGQITDKEAAARERNAKQQGAPEVYATIQTLLDELVIAYEQSVERKPRRSEIIDSFRFVVNANPEQYLRTKTGLDSR